MKLPQNKLARLSINGGLIGIWLFLTDAGLSIPGGLLNQTGFITKIWLEIYSNFGNPYNDFGYWMWLLIRYIPVVLVTRYIWWGRLKPRPRITRSHEEEQAGKKWDSVVDELRNRK
tara:strand:- start:86 stop:433 length:348 start_codon:yes stop_codon:yes gene_type:complete